MHLLTGPVDPTLREHGAGDREPVSTPGGADSEAPRVEVLVVLIHGDERAIAAELHGHVAALGGVVLACRLVGRGGRFSEVVQLRESLRVGARRGEHRAVRAMQRDLSVRPRLAVAHTGHPHHPFLRTESSGHTQIGDLHEGDGRVGESGVVLGECAAADLHGVERRRVGTGRIGDRERDASERAAVATGGHGDPPHRSERGDRVPELTVAP